MAGDDTNLRLFALFIAIYQHDLRTNSGDFRSPEGRRLIDLAG